MKTIIQTACQFYGQGFETSNIQKKFCSSTCRTYSSLERNGKLPERIAQKRRLLQESQEGQRNVSPPSNSQKQLRTKLLMGHLESLFTIESKYNIFYKDQETGLCAYQDIELSLQRIRATPEGNFILTSTSKTLIESLQEEYNDSPIFMRSTKPIRENAPSPTQMDELQDAYENGEEVYLTREVRYNTYPTYSTLLKWVEVQKVARIPIGDL